MNPKYPIYIPTKNRFNSRLTIKTLNRLNVPFFVVIEPSEFSLYKQILDERQILILPAENYKLFRARNWIKAHSIATGHAKHWQLDDNIRQFNRLNRNKQVRVTSGTIFRAAEDFHDRFENVAFSGFEYDFFAKQKYPLKPFRINTRIYSCTLVDNRFDFAWRSEYNDDTDVCLQALKAGYCTILFNAFLQEKMQTMTVPGGNTEQLYLIENGRLKMAEALRELHPDCVKVSWKFGRPQHHVCYKPFKNNKLIFRDDKQRSDRPNNYGMKLIQI